MNHFSIGHTAANEGKLVGLPKWFHIKTAGLAAPSATAVK
jgi:hypothetical protein